MEYKERLKTRLTAVRTFSEGLLKTFEKPEEWFFQVHPTANHAAWIVGHLGWAENSILNLLKTGDGVDDADWKPLFGQGSQPTPDPTRYPPVDELLGFFRERRERMGAFLDRQSNDTLLAMLPPGTHRLFTDLASVFEFIPFHETMHMGQLTVVRQSLKHAPLIPWPKK